MKPNQQKEYWKEKYNELKEYYEKEYIKKEEIEFEENQFQQQIKEIIQSFIQSSIFQKVKQQKQNVLIKIIDCYEWILKEQLFLHQNNHLKEYEIELTTKKQLFENYLLFLQSKQNELKKILSQFESEVVIISEKKSNEYSFEQKYKDINEKYIEISQLFTQKEIELKETQQSIQLLSEEMDSITNYFIESTNISFSKFIRLNPSNIYMKDYNLFKLLHDQYLKNQIQIQLNEQRINELLGKKEKKEDIKQNDIQRNEIHSINNENTQETTSQISIPINTIDDSSFDIDDEDSSYEEDIFATDK